MRNMHPIAGYLRPYFNAYLAGTRGLSSNTILAYRDTHKLFFCFAADHLCKEVDQLNVEDLDEKVVLAFLEYLEKVRGNCIKTRNLRLAGIRSFFGFIARQSPELIDDCKRVRSIPSKRTEHKTAVYLDNAEIDTVLNSVNPDTPMGLRDRALLHFIYNTGARVSEVVGVGIGDLRLDELGQVSLLGKGKRHRACPLWPETINSLKDYLQARHSQNSQSEALFLNAQDEPITRSGIAYIVRKYAVLAGKRCTSILSKTVSPHTFRHSIAMTLIRAGQEINMVQDFLGHANINTTHAYFELDMDMKRKVLEKSAPQTANEKQPRWLKPRVLAFLANLTKGDLAPAAPS